MIGGAASAQTNINLGGIAVDTAAAIEVTSDSLSVDQETGIAVFEGDVLIAQGDLRLAAARVQVIYGTDTSQIARLIATGDVTFVTAEEAAEAETADYDITTGLLTLTGDVLLTQGASAISAESMVVNVTDGTATMQGRVRTVLQQGGN
ncbi:lipopolysaccharide transport periplasmic protein LptA [Yoonia vestfoldensis]|uniref:lipopolysaccharide transport periplasmic protein LptA n=1 Tax=Yoonia vestfoldensis TaxID=245188 RepID=UPI000685429F|nr:lipopolysaccharide transport periplasmic protein LptA [Yoonia vestfoldensis]